MQFNLVPRINICHTKVYLNPKIYCICFSVHVYICGWTIVNVHTLLFIFNSYFVAHTILPYMIG